MSDISQSPSGDKTASPFVTKMSLFVMRMSLGASLQAIRTADRIELSEVGQLPFAIESFGVAEDGCVSAPEAVVPRFAMKPRIGGPPATTNRWQAPWRNFDQRGAGVEAVPPDHLRRRVKGPPYLYWHGALRYSASIVSHEGRSKPAR